MTRSLCTALVAGALALAATATPAASLAPFRSDAELARTLDAWKARRLREAERRDRAMKATPALAMAPPPAPPAAPVAESAASLDAVQVAGSASGDSITNNQVQGVDEGDIVKRAGDVLVVLRRGRLFTVRVGGDALQPVASVDAFGPDVDPSGTGTTKCWSATAPSRSLATATRAAAPRSACSTSPGTARCATARPTSSGAATTTPRATTRAA